MRRALIFLIETNLHIAFAAVAFLMANARLLGIPFRPLLPLCVQVFFATWFVYQLSRWLYHRERLHQDQDDYVFAWFRRHPSVSKGMMSISAACALFSVVFLKGPTILLLAAMGGVSVLYALPVLRPFGTDRRLRDVPFLKIFLIALVWSGTSVLLPVTEYGWELDNHRESWILFLTQFFFIFFITLPFDINDHANDLRTGVKTFPTVFGRSVSIGLMGLLFLLHGAGLLYFFTIRIWMQLPEPSFRESYYLSVMALCLGLFLYAVRYADKVRKWIIKLVYDSSMILYLFIVLVTVKQP